MVIAFPGEIVATKKGQPRKPPDVAYGRLIAQLRAEADLTQVALAERLDLTPDGYRMYEKGYSRVSQKTLLKWAKALNKPTTELADVLGIELIVSSDPGTLRQQLDAICGPEIAGAFDQLIRDVCGLSLGDQQILIESWLDQVTGRNVRRQRD